MFLNQTITMFNTKLRGGGGGSFNNPKVKEPDQDKIFSNIDSRLR